MERYEIKEERQWGWQEWTESQQAAVPADTERIRVIGAHAPDNATHFLVAVATVIRYGEFGTETDGKPRKWQMVKNKEYNWRQQKEGPESPFIRLVSKSGHCCTVHCPPVFVFGAMSNEHLNRGKR